MKRLLPADFVPASGKNYAHYYDLVRRFQYLQLTDEESARTMAEKGDADFRSSLEDIHYVPETFIPQHWEAFLFFGVQDEADSGNPEPAIVTIQTESKNVNDASKLEVLSRADSKKRSGSYLSSGSTNKDASDMLRELTKKAKIESENLRHTAQESILRKINLLQSTDLQEGLKKTLLEKYVGQLQEE